MWEKVILFVFLITLQLSDVHSSSICISCKFPNPETSVTVDSDGNQNFGFLDVVANGLKIPITLTYSGAIVGYKPKSFYGRYKGYAVDLSKVANVTLNYKASDVKGSEPFIQVKRVQVWSKSEKEKHSLSGNGKNFCPSESNTDVEGYVKVYGGKPFVFKTSSLCDKKDTKDDE